MLNFPTGNPSIRVRTTAALPSILQKHRMRALPAGLPERCKMIGHSILCVYMTLVSPKALRIELFNSTMCKNLSNYASKKKKQSSPSILLFLSGKGSPAWLSTVGWKCGVDPEFWLRHLGIHLEPNDNRFFTQPALPSSSQNIVRLKIPTIGYREHDEVYSQKKLDNLRKVTQEEMQNYNMAFRQGIQTDTGISIVRSFAMHDLNHFSLEQEISLCVNEFGGGWIGEYYLLGTRYRTYMP